LPIETLSGAPRISGYPAALVRVVGIRCRSIKHGTYP
jgi:hypothetical protein